MKAKLITTLLFLFFLVYTSILYSQFGPIDLVVDRTGIASENQMGMAPPIRTLAGFFYTTGLGGQGLDIYKTIGDTIFLGQPIRSVQNPISFRNVNHIDLDKDQDWDLIGLDKKTIVIYYNNGQNNFEEGIVIYEDLNFPRVISINNLIVLDIDGDGHQDITFTAHSSTSDRIVVLINDGTGQFKKYNSFLPELLHFSSLTKADFDNNGKEDILHFDLYNAYLTFADIDSLVSIRRTIISDLPWEAESRHHPISGYPIDLDNDKDLDILFTIPLSPPLTYWLENLGDRNFAPYSKLTNFLGNKTIRGIFDINENGDSGILVCDGDNLLAYHNQNGQFDSVFTIIDDNITSKTSIESGDFDADGRLDLLVGGSPYSYFYWYRKTEEGFEKIIIDSEFSSSTGLRFFDTDCDNHLEIIPSNHHLIKSYKEDVFYLKQNDYLPYQRFFSQNELIGDLNGDNFSELVFKSNNCIFIFQNENGKFNSIDSICPIDDNIDLLSLVDYNQDNLLDLLYEGKNAWFVQLNEGNLTFSAPVQLDNYETGAFPNYTFFNYYTTISLLDFDNDSIPDLVSDQSQAIFTRKGLGNGEYEKTFNRIINKLEDDQKFIDKQFADWNGDGLIDIIGFTNSRYGSRDLGLSLNLGDFNFEDHGLILPFPIIGFRIIDWDQDSHPDLIYVTDNGTFLSRNKNGGELDAPVKLVSSKSNDFYLEDLHNDGDLDYIRASNYGEIAIAINYSEALTISGRVFDDQNRDGVFNEGEFLIPNAQIHIAPTGLATYTKPSSGEYIFYVSAGEFTVTASSSECWMPLDTNAFKVNVLTGSQEVNFPFVKIPEDTTILHTSILHGFARCNQSTTSWVTIENLGCNNTNARLTLYIDKTLMVESFDIPPTFQVGDTLYWDFEQLPPETYKTIAIQLAVPGADFLGADLDFSSRAYILTDTETMMTHAVNSFIQVRCAYDPNDKLVTPFNTEEGNPTNFEVKDYDYTIRFQNTGNDTAFKVVIIDTLSVFLDLNTLKPLTASDSFRTELNFENRTVQFIFDPILLPDSTTNLAESMGFVSFSIQPMEDLAINTKITNQAGIYFDQNPAIITNIVCNTISDLQTSYEAIPFDNYLIDYQINPNPNQGNFTMVMTPNDNRDSPLNFQLINLFGRVVYQTIIFPSSHQVSVSLPNEKSGIFFSVLRDEEGDVIAPIKKIMIAH